MVTAFATFGYLPLGRIPLIGRELVLLGKVIRLVVRTYFHADLPALSNASYWSSAKRPYKFVGCP